MRKRRRRSPTLMDVLMKDPGRPSFSGDDQAIVACAARRAFVAFFRGVFNEGGQGPRSTT